jgi:hypothetical protein
MKRPFLAKFQIMQMILEDRRARLITRLDTIVTELKQLLISDHLFWQLQEIVRSNENFKDQPGLFTRWIAENYSRAAAIGVRRQSKLNKDSISLRGFLDEVKKFPDLISRDHYLSLYAGKEDWHKKMGRDDFDRVAGKGSSTIPISLVDKQIDKIVTSSKSVENYVDRRIAHYDKREPAKPLPTFDDITTALKAMEEIAILYLRLLKGASMNTVTPTIVFDWDSVLRFAWKP